MADAEKLTLAGAFGVDLDALARRIAERQTEIGRDDDACAQLAGVSVDRWRAWKEGRGVPGVGRVPGLASALTCAASWILYGPAEREQHGAGSSTFEARLVVELVGRLAPAVDIVEKLAEEIARLNLPIPGGERMAVALGQASTRLARADAVTTYHVEP